MWKDRVAYSCQLRERERESLGIFNQRRIVSCYATLTRADTIGALIYVNELSRRSWDNEANLNEFGSWLDQNSLSVPRGRGGGRALNLSSILFAALESF